MIYPGPMCGDRAEFELEHANTPPKERPDWPLPSFDACNWAEAFCKVAKEKGFDPVKDEDWVQGWFANALMRGYDEHAARSQSEVERLRAALREIASPLATMQDRATKEGSIFNGETALNITSNPEYYRQLARAALR